MASPVPIQKAPPPAPATRGRMALSNITQGKVERPPMVLLIGQEKIGKSTWASKAPSPIFMDVESGTGHLDVKRMPQPETFEDVLEGLHALTTEPHDFKTLVVDTIDWVEPMIWKHVAKMNGVDSIESVGGGFGKGYAAALDEWRRFLAALERLHKTRNMGVILLAHVRLRTVNNPEGPDYDRYEGMLHQSKNGVGAYTLVKQFVSHILFARHKDYAVKGDDKKIRGISDGTRVLCTQRTAAFDAGTRGDLPAELPLEWDDFAAALAAHRPADPAKLEAECAEMIPTVGDADGKLGAYLNTIRGDAAKLAHFKNRLAAKVAEKGA